ncbi:MAG: DNA cytosine methyltransferase [bacterium]
MNVLGLFSGIGGFELGLQRAGFEISALCEIEKPCIKVLEKNFPDIPIIEDVNNIRLKGGEYDVICGGFTCSDISIASKTATGIQGERSGIWKEFKRIIKEGKPKYAVIENVSGLLSRGLEVVLQDLAEIGYDASWTTYDSKFFGTPQRRRRVYIVGIRDGIPANTDIFKFRERYSTEHQQKVASFNNSFEWDFTKKQGIEHPFAYFTRQRSDEFACTGLSSTLMKRDYKDFTDLVLQDNILRRVTPTERLILQTFPKDWFDDCDLSDSNKIKYNGMTVNVIQYIGNCIKDFDNERNV